MTLGYAASACASRLRKATPRPRSARRTARRPGRRGRPREMCRPILGGGHLEAGEFVQRLRGADRRRRSAVLHSALAQRRPQRRPRGAAAQIGDGRAACGGARDPGHAGRAGRLLPVEVRLLTLTVDEDGAPDLFQPQSQTATPDTTPGSQTRSRVKRTPTPPRDLGLVDREPRRRRRGAASAPAQPRRGGEPR